MDALREELLEAEKETKAEADAEVDLEAEAEARSGGLPVLAKTTPAAKRKTSTAALGRTSKKAKIPPTARHISIKRYSVGNESSSKRKAIDVCPDCHSLSSQQAERMCSGISRSRQRWRWG